MIQVSPALRAALNSTANEPLDLYELYLDSGTLYFADQAIFWGGHQYVAAVESRSQIRRYDGDQFDSVTVTFSNVNLQMAGVLLTNDIEGRRLIIRKIDRSVPGDSVVLFVGEMERPSSIGEKDCTIEAKQIVGSVEHEAPARLFSPYCPFEPGEWECGQPAGVPCDKSWSRCAELGNTARYGGFRFVPHSGTYQYEEITKKRFLLLFSRKKKKTITASFSSVDDTPYDVPIPLIYGRVQIAGIVIQHADEGGVTKALAAFASGKMEHIFYLRANQAAITDYTLHLGYLGEANGVDPRFPNSYPYSLVAYAGVTIPSDVAVVDPAPEITAVVKGSGVAHFGPNGQFLGWWWSDNPIWCVRDFMTRPLAQGGMGLPDDWFDDALHYQEAAYCDELINDPTNSQKIYRPPQVPEGVDYRRYRSTGVEGGDIEADGPYADYEPGVDDDTSRVPIPVQVKRFTLNVAIAKQEKAVDILFNKLLPAFRGYLTFSKDGKIQIRCERPVPNSTLASAAGAGSFGVVCNSAIQCAPGDTVLLSPFTAQAEALVVSSVNGANLGFVTPTQFAHSAGAQIWKIAMAFDDSNVIGSFEYPLSDRQPSTNRITIKYVDAPAGFEARELRVNSYEHQVKIRRIENEDVDGSAIDSYFQAWRIGQWRLAKARDLGRFCSFRADIKATLLEIGDVIAVSATECGLQCVPFRVIELAFEENDEVTVLGQLYSLGIYDDTAPQTTVTVPVIFNLPKLPGQEIPGRIRPIGDQPFLLSQTEDGINAIFDLEYDPPSPIGAFSGVTAHWVPDGAPKPAAAVDFDYLGNPAAGDEARHGKCQFVVPQGETEVSGRIYVTERSKSYKAPLVPYGRTDPSPSREVTISQATGVTAPPRVVSVTLAEKPASRRLVQNEDGAWVTLTTLQATVELEADPRPNQWAAIELSRDNKGHWDGWTHDKPITSETQTFDLDLYVPAVGNTFWARAWSRIPGYPGSAAEAVESESGTYIPPHGLPSPYAVTNATVVVKERQTVDGLWLWGGEVSFRTPMPEEEPYFFHATVWIEWVDEDGNADPNYLGEWRQVSEPGKYVTLAADVDWPYPAPGTRYRIPRYSITVHNRVGDKVKQFCWPGDADYFDVQLEPKGSQVGDAPNVHPDTTAQVWYKTVGGQRVFGFEGVVVPPDPPINFSGCEIYLHWIERYDGDVPVYDDRYISIERVGAEGGPWHANEPGFPLQPSWSQDVDVVFVPRNRFGVENADKSAAFSIRLTVTSEAEDTPLVTGTAHVWTRDDPGGRVFGFGGTVSDGAAIYLHWIEGWNGEIPIYDPRYLLVWEAEPGGGTWTTDPAGWRLQKNWSQQCDVVFKPRSAEGVIDEDPTHWFIVRVTGELGGIGVMTLAAFDAETNDGTEQGPSEYVLVYVIDSPVISHAVWDVVGGGWHIFAGRRYLGPRNTDELDVQNWVWLSYQGTASFANVAGALRLTCPPQSGNNWRAIGKPIPGGATTIRATIAAGITDLYLERTGLLLYEQSSGKAVGFGPYNDSGLYLTAYRLNSFTVAPSKIQQVPWSITNLEVVLEVEISEGFLIYRYMHPDSGEPIILAQQAITVPFTTAPTHWGILGCSNNGVEGIYVDLVSAVWS
ncbi:MAG: phage tail protein [bacterium]